MTKALARDPTDDRLLRRTFMLKLGVGQWREAVPLARRIVDSETSAVLAQTVLIADDIRNSTLESAAARVAALPVSGVGRVLQALAGAWVSSAAGRPDEALQHLDPLADSGGRKLQALHAAWISERAGRLEESARWLRRAAVGELRSLRMILALGGHLERRGKVDAVRQLYRGFDGGTTAVTVDLSDLEAEIASVPIDTSVGLSPTEGLAQVLFDLANALHQDESDELALIYGRLALALHPRFALAALFLGDVLRDRGRDEDALAHYHRALEAAPFLRGTIKLRLADTLSDAGRHGDAIETLEALLITNPDWMVALQSLGDEHRRVGAYEQAIERYSAALAQAPPGSEERWPILYGRAIALDRVGRWPMAERDLEQAIAINPNHPSLLNYLGYTWADRGENLPQALDMIQRAVAQRPEDGYIIDSLGWVLFRLGDIGGAIRHLERAVELVPLDPTINDHLGDAYLAAGRHLEAVFQWRRALSHVGDNTTLETAIRRKLSKQAAHRVRSQADGT